MRERERGRGQKERKVSRGSKRERGKVEDTGGGKGGRKEEGRKR